MWHKYLKKNNPQVENILINVLLIRLKKVSQILIYLKDKEKIFFKV